MAVLLAIATCSGQTQDQQRAKVTVKIVDNRGAAIPSGTLSIRSGDGAAIYSAQVRSTVSLDLPYGRYVVSFETEFFRPVRREVTINQREELIVLATHMDRVVLDVRHDPISVSLHVTPGTACSDDGILWARLVGVFSDYSAVRRVSPMGFALFEPVEFGTYTVLIVDGSAVRATKIFDTTRSVTVVDVPLSECK